MDAKALNVEGATEDGRCEKQSFYYESRSINEDERYVADTSCQKWQSAQSWEAAEYIEEFNNAFVPTYEGHCFEGWYDDSEEYYLYTFPDNNDRTYHAKWSLDLDSIIPNLDSYFGIDDGDGFDGIQFSQEGRNVYYSFQIKQEDYKDIEVGEDEELKLYVQHGAKRPIAGNNDNIYIDENNYYKIKEPAYTVDVDQSAPVLSVKYQLFDSFVEDYNDGFQLRLKYLIVKKDDENKIKTESSVNELENTVNIVAQDTLPAPTLDTTFGQNGIDYIWDKDANGKDRLSVSFRVPKTDYKDIELSDDEILKLAFYCGTKKPNLKNSGSPDTSGTYKGYYIGWNAETVKDSSGLRTDPVAGGMNGEIHDFGGDYFKVTMPVFCPYDGKYSDNIYLGLEYVIQNKSDCEETETETINWDKAIVGKLSEDLCKKPVFINLQYPTGQADAQIKDGSTIIEPADIREIPENSLTEASYVLDGAKNYTFATTAVNGYKISKVSYKSGSSTTAWSATKSFKPSVDNSVIYVEATAVYSPILMKGDSELSPDSKSVYNASYMDTIKFKIKKGADTIEPAKIVTKVGKKVIETLDGGSSPKFYDLGAYHGQKVTIELYEDVNAKAVTTCSVQVTAPLSSVTLKNKNVLKPAIDSPAVTSVIVVNKGADINSIGIKYTYGMNVSDTAPDFIDISLENGVLTIRPNENCAEGQSVYLCFYDKEREPGAFGWFDPGIALGKYEVITQAPAWANKTPNASLLSANDYQLEFKATAPSKTVFDSQYYAAVRLSDNNNTAKNLKEGLAVNDTVQYIQIHPDGNIPPISINAFKNVSDGTEVMTLGNGCGTSVTADVYIVKTINNEYPTESNILASSAHKKLTVSTKKPYYADKITLKKTAAASKLYVGTSHTIVATVAFDKNATYTRPQDWKIANADELRNQSLDVAQYGDNGIDVDICSAKQGTYTIKVETVPPEGGVPATASVDITVLPTANIIEMDDIISIYHKPGTAISYKVSPTVLDYYWNVLKNASLSYMVGKDNGSGEYEPTTNLSVSKGTIKSNKNFVAGSDRYAIKITATCGKSIESEWIPIEIIEERVSPTSFGFLLQGTQATIEDTMTLLQYNNLGWSEYIENFPETLGIENMYFTEEEPGAGFVLKDAAGNIIPKELIKSISIPNPAYIKKAGKITLSATTIDGTKLKKTINIVADVTKEYDALYIEYENRTEKEAYRINSAEPYDVGGLSTFTQYVVYLADSDNPEDANTKNNISGDTLTVSGAKIVDKMHGDCLAIVMTQRVATITRTHKNKKIVYTLINDSFKLSTLKIKARNGDKLYSTYFGDSQSMHYDFEGNYEQAESVKVYSSNSAFINNGIADCFSIDGNTVLCTMSPSNWGSLKPGAYPFSLEILDKNGKALCKATSLSLKIDKLSKKFKFTNKYTMSMADMASVPLIETTSGVKTSEITGLYNANVKGSYDNPNNIKNYLTLVTDTETGTGTLQIKEGADLTGIKSLNGYVGYRVTYLDGTTEERLEKVTVDIKKQIGKYSLGKKWSNNSQGAEFGENSIFDAKGNEYEAIAMKLSDSKKNSPYIEDIQVIDSLNNEAFIGLEAFDGKLYIALSDPANRYARLKKGTYKATAIAILKNSGFTGTTPKPEDFDKYGVEVTITINVPSGTIYI